jgi:hypothetical protein
MKHIKKICTPMNLSIVIFLIFLLLVKYDVLGMGKIPYYFGYGIGLVVNAITSIF